MVGENERGEVDKGVSPPSLVFEPPPEEGGQHQQQEGARVPKTSLPARMSDLYQVVELFFCIESLKSQIRPLLRATQRTQRRW